MDEKKEDKSKESKKNHIAYYKSLKQIITDIQKEKGGEPNSTIKEHLDGRIDAMEKDLKRIRDMFPDVTEEEWDDNTN